MSLAVSELSEKASAAAEMLSSGDGSSSEGFNMCLAVVIRACQELMQASGLAAYLSHDAARRESLNSDVLKISTLAKYCLEQASSSLRLSTPPPSPVISSAPRSRSPRPPQAPAPPPPTVVVPPALMRTRSLKNLPEPCGVASPGDVQVRAGGESAESTASSPSSSSRAHAGMELELVPGMEVDERDLSMLRDCDEETLNRINTPARELQLLNGFLMKKYQASLFKISGGGAGAGSRQQASELNLGLLRQQNENWSIAKAKQLALIRDTLATQREQRMVALQRVQREQARHEQQFSVLQSAVVGKDGRGGPAARLVSKGAAVFKESLLTKFKQVHDTSAANAQGGASGRAPKIAVGALGANDDIRQMMADGGDVAAVVTTVRRMLVTPFHPLCRRLNEFAARVAVPGLCPPDITAQIKSLVKVVTQDALLYLKVNPDGPGYSAVYEVVSDAVVSRFYTPLMAHLGDRLREADRKTNSKMDELGALATPASLEIKESLWLCGVGDGERASEAAYEPAIEAMRTVGRSRSALGKLKCLVGVLTRIGECVDSFNPPSFVPDQERVRLGAEELVPVFAYVLLKSGLLNAHSEAALMEEFMCDWMGADEEGYALATFMTCTEYIDSLTLDQLFPSAPSSSPPLYAATQQGTPSLPPVR